MPFFMRTSSGAYLLLLTTNFRILHSIIDEVLARDAERKRQQSPSQEEA